MTGPSRIVFTFAKMKFFLCPCSYKSLRQAGKGKFNKAYAYQISQKVHGRLPLPSLRLLIHTHMIYLRFYRLEH